MGQGYYYPEAGELQAPQQEEQEVDVAQDDHLQRH
jgi:hypothetical protein